MCVCVRRLSLRYVRNVQNAKQRYDVETETQLGPEEEVGPETPGVAEAETRFHLLPPVLLMHLNVARQTGVHQACSNKKVRITPV